MGTYEVYWSRKAAHRCVRCGEQMDESYTFVRCQLCREFEALQKREKYRTDCRKRSRETGRRTAPGSDNTEYHHKKREERRAAGLCIYCGKAPARPNRTMCPNCALMAADRQACYYANKKLKERK